jgi:hypothetical protein
MVHIVVIHSIIKSNEKNSAYPSLNLKKGLSPETDRAFFARLFRSKPMTKCRGWLSNFLRVASVYTLK